MNQTSRSVTVPSKSRRRAPERLRGNQINWNQVFYFSEIAAAGSLKEAAQRLGVSPSTLSEQVSQLERDLEVQLFLRHHRKLVLTAEGNRLYLRAKEMFEAGQRLIDVVSPVPLGCYPISVGLVPCPSIQVAYELIGNYVEQRDLNNMKLFHSRYQELETGLAKAQFDFGFSDRVPERKDLVHERIATSQTRFYVSKRWADQPFSALLTHLPLLISNAEPETRSLAEQSLQDSGLTPTGVITADYPSVLTDLCRRGLGIGVFSEISMDHLTLESLKTLRNPKDAPRIQDHLYLIWARDGENTEAVRSLIDLLARQRKGERRGTA